MQASGGVLRAREPPRGKTRQALPLSSYEPKGNSRLDLGLVSLPWHWEGKIGSLTQVLSPLHLLQTWIHISNPAENHPRWSMEVAVHRPFRLNLQPLKRTDGTTMVFQGNEQLNITPIQCNSQKPSFHQWLSAQPSL